MVFRISLAMSAIALVFLFATAPTVSAQGCDVPPTECEACQMTNPENKKTYCLTMTCTSIGGTSGMCTAKCKCGANTSTGQGGEKQGMGDAKGMMDALKGVMDMLKQAMEKKGGGGGQGQQPQQGQQGLPQGCTQYYQVTAPSTDPCAYYVPPTSDSLLQTTSLLSGSEELLNSLNEGSALNVSERLLGNSGESSSQTSQAETGTTDGEAPSEGTKGAPAAASPASKGRDLSEQQVNLQSGTRGNIVETEGGATIEAQSRDINANTEVAGFYGSGDTSQEPQGIIARMCRNRPWASSVVSFVIPPVFFDSLCAWRGYQVGSPAPPALPVVENVTAVSSTTSPRGSLLRPNEQNIEPRLQIWAVPDTVSLGARTSVFWNASGVESCAITSGDGSFSESTLSGGAATVPLAGPTTFTISCLTAASTTVADFVTVQLAI